MNSTILFGNGLNNLSENPLPWNALLDKIKGSTNFDNGKLPNTMIYERALFENHTKKDIRLTELHVKNSIAELLFSIETNEFYQSIFDLNCKNYLTTNYDYAFKNTILEGEKFKSHNLSTEDIYSIRRQTAIYDITQKERCRIWNIHGEINLPISIMLGLDHYCGSVSKLDAYVKGNYDIQENKEKIRLKSMTVKLKENQFDSRSWAELFFNSDVHILGLALDYSETDLWWILTKRARILNEEKTSTLIKNKIYFYDRYITDEKVGLLKSLNVTVIMPIKENKEMTWSQYYSNTIGEIRSKIEQPDTNISV